MIDRRKVTETDKELLRNQIDSFMESNGRLIAMADAMPYMLSQYDEEFSEKTSLTKIDWCFLFVAIGLQMVRQYCFTTFPERKDDQSAAKDVKGSKREKSNRKHRYYNPSKTEILTNPVPFDANLGANGALKGGGIYQHRGATLGHDPLLGLVFGTANIATSTLTNKRFESFHIETGINHSGNSQDVFGERASTQKVIEKTIEKLLNDGDKEGREKVALSLVKEVVHLQSDKFSKKSLPLPVITIISPDLSSFLAGCGVDWGNLTVVSKQAGLAIMINSLVAMLHAMYGYIAKEDPKLYKVRTAKVLEYSNAIASIANLGVVAVTHDLKKLDVGGIAVAILTIIKSEKFIRAVREDFLSGRIVEWIEHSKGNGDMNIKLSDKECAAKGRVEEFMSTLHGSHFDENVEKISKAVGEWAVEDRDAVQRMRHSFIGDRGVFVCPQGWDQKFWRGKFSEYCRTAQKDSGKDIFLGFLENVQTSVEVFKGGDKFDVAQIVRIKNVLSLSPENLVVQDGRDLEMIIDFIDLLGVKSRRIMDPEDSVMSSTEDWLCDVRNNIRAAIGELCKANVLILGRRGAGKSTIINLLLGDSVCDVHIKQKESVFDRIWGALGVGGRRECQSPTTDFLNRHEGFSNGVPIVVYDSIGIEDAHRIEWIEALERERERNNCRSKVYDWFHIILYCIDASEGKVDDLDVRAVNAMIKDGHAVRVLLTKSDQVDAQTIEQVKCRVKECVQSLISKDILSIGSDMNDADGLRRFALESYSKTLLNILPKRCCYLMHEKLADFVRKTKIEISGQGWFECEFGGEHFSMLRKRCEAYTQEMNDQIIPQIVKDEIRACLGMERNISEAISVDFSKMRKDTRIFEQDDKWYDTLGKSVLLPLLFVPALIVSGPSAKDDEQGRLADSLEVFRKEFAKQIDDMEGKMTCRLSELFGWNEMG